MAFLEGPSPKQEEFIKQELGEGPGDLERGLRDLHSMCAANPYLPQPEALDTNLLKTFLRGCRMDFERARKKLETFCYSRSRYRDLFEHRSLNEPPLNDVCKFLDIVPLPKLTDEGLRVTIFRVRPNYPESSSDILAAVRAVLLICDVRLRDETLIAGDVFIWEATHVRASIAARVAAAAGAVRRSIQLAQAAYPQRMRRIHVVGAPALVASSLNLMRACVNEKVRKRYYLHDKTEELLEHIPARVLPVEWGGEEESIEVLNRKWRRRVDEMRDYLRDLSELCDVTPDTLYDNDIYGAVGSFRKLDID
ncbi:retinol-binding protein pinta-like [Danaus plexippus]|uniref:Alpha-tocopherol transfer protein n=1 Tax=Danaus plexippus plexippus TaxID=278856 RepID=A0A212FML0_DANPL|nr:retinol-binding protein pinta-like [Danaus plexippus]OWR54967.1 Alpha-tocopherol transfer protein [Danaus plexippus plexippus]